MYFYYNKLSTLYALHRNSYSRTLGSKEGEKEFYDPFQLVVYAHAQV
jgi:hypothetical protein